MKSCTNCRGNLADFVTVCPYCGVAQPVAQAPIAQPGWEMPQQNSNKAIASLVCGVLLCFGPLTAIPAIVLGHLALAEIKRASGRMAGHGMAIAGLILGYFGVVISTAYLIFMVFVIRGTIGTGNIPANEATAVTTMRAYDQALKSYAAKCPQQGYPATLLPLGPGTGDCKRANLIDFRLAVRVPVRQGYTFVYSTGAPTTGKLTAFALVARPITPGMSGTRYFYLDETGVIRESANQNIGPNSNPLGESQKSENQNLDNEDDNDEQADAPNPDSEKPQDISANEAATISNLRRYSLAMQTYAKNCPQQGYPITLMRLGPGTGDCQHAKLVDSNMAVQDPVLHGYEYQWYPVFYARLSPLYRTCGTPLKDR